MAALPAGFAGQPSRSCYDVVIVGGAIMGSAVAWFLSRKMDFHGRVLVVERDPSFAMCSTAHTNSCIRQQFSTELNVRISQFTADFIKNLRGNMDDDPRVPNLSIRSFGYLYLANTPGFAQVLREKQAVQRAAGAATRLLTPDEILAAYPFYNVDDILLGSINTQDEGYFDGATLFDWFRRQAREAGVEYVADEVTAMTLHQDNTRVESVMLASGGTVRCGRLVNATGPRASRTAAMAGIQLPVEPRKRFTWIFRAEDPLEIDLPLTIDPSGVHVHENGGGTYMAGAHDAIDPAVDPADFEMNHAIWLDHVWPVIANRIPRFEAIRVENEWVGHYAYNVVDQNAVIGPHPDVTNFFFLNGFSGHGLQQAPAMGRGMAELLCHDAFQTLDLSPFAFDRIAENRPIPERAVI